MKNSKLHRDICQIFKAADPEKIIIFGSYASGNEDPYSDIDLIIILKSDKRFLDRLRDLYQMWTLDKGVDIFAYTPEEFETMLAEENPFLEKVLDEGEVIYERAAA